MKLFITFELKGFRHKERDTKSFYADFSICPPHHVWYSPQGLGELRKSTFFFGGKNSTNCLFSNLSPCFRSVTSFTSPGPISYLRFYFDICEWCMLPVRAWTPALMLHLTNPCAKRKVLSLTKPKGKIYKTKYFGHYIRNLFQQTTATVKRSSR